MYTFMEYLLELNDVYPDMYNNIAVNIYFIMFSSMVPRSLSTQHPPKPDSLVQINISFFAPYLQEADSCGC